MLDSTLKDYIKIYKKFYDVEFCKDVVKQLDEANWVEHYFYNPNTKSSVSYENELSTSYDSILSKKILDEKIWHVLNKYVKEDFKHFESWFSSWSGYTFCRFNKYDPSTQMKLHCDHIHSIFDGNNKGVPVLTVLGALNEEYDGGEFLLCEKEFELNTGDVIVFPSNFLYPHEVKPVKSGIRYSFVSWAW